MKKIHPWRTVILTAALTSGFSVLGFCAIVSILIWMNLKEPCCGMAVPRGAHEAAEWGLAKAQYDLGCCYYFGHGVGQDMTEAAKWWKKAAEQGDERAKQALERLQK